VIDNATATSAVEAARMRRGNIDALTVAVLSRTRVGR
jgi:hypothetical protein